MTDEERFGVYREELGEYRPAEPFDAGTFDFVPWPASVSPEETDSDPLACLILEMSAGHVEALRRLHASCEASVKKVALRVTGDEALAEDISVATFLQAWLQAGRFNPHRGTGLSWLLCMARSRSIDALRTEDAAIPHPDPLSLLDQEADRWADPQELALEAERARQVHRALNDLTPLHRQLLALAYFKGLTHEEIARQASLPLGTVKSHIKRAIAKLRRALANYWRGESSESCLVKRTVAPRALRS